MLPWLYLVVLSVQEEVQHDEVVVMSWWFHVKDKAMDAVLDERPQEPARQKEHWENVLMDRDRDVWKHTHTDNDTNPHWVEMAVHTYKCEIVNENEHYIHKACIKYGHITRYVCVCYLKWGLCSWCFLLRWCSNTNRNKTQLEATPLVPSTCRKKPFKCFQLKNSSKKKKLNCSEVSLEQSLPSPALLLFTHLGPPSACGSHCYKITIIKKPIIFMMYSK